MIIIGIDPGVNTGFAAWDTEAKKLLEVSCYQAVEAEIRVLRYCIWYEPNVFLLFEDARLRKWYGTKGAEALQGVGSIKRDCSRWEEFCIYHKIPHKGIAPQKGATKWTAERFAKVTGWKGKTNEHARDAAMMVYGRNAIGV